MRAHLLETSFLSQRSPHHTQSGRLTVFQWTQLCGRRANQEELQTT